MTFMMSVGVQRRWAIGTEIPACAKTVGEHKLRLLDDDITFPSYLLISNCADWFTLV